MNDLTTFRGPVTDGRYDVLLHINHLSDINEIEANCFDLSLGDKGKVIAQLNEGQIYFTVPFKRLGQDVLDEGIGYFRQPWDLGGCELFPIAVAAP